MTDAKGLSEVQVKTLLDNWGIREEVQALTGWQTAMLWLAKSHTALAERLKACEEVIEGDKQMDALLWQKLKKAAAAIKAGDQWPENAWPSPHERCWYVAAKERINDLTADLASALAEVERLKHRGGYAANDQD